MKVSFVIPSYNQGQFIGQCLDSIAQQGLPPSSFETIVQDGGSTDGTLDILRSHSLQPNWESGKDNGQAHALNLALQKASGDIIAWINSDDYYLPGAIGTILGYYTSSNPPDVLYGNAIQVDTEGNKTGDYPVEDWNYLRLADKCFLCQPATFFHRRIYEEYGGSDENFHLALDMEYWLRIGKATPFLRIPETLAAAREYSANKSQSNPLRQQTEALWAGYLHTGKFSNKRLWAIAGNRLLESGPTKDSPSFAIRKSLAYLRLCWEIINKDYPWLHLPADKPRQVT